MNNIAEEDAGANENVEDLNFQFEREMGQMRPDKETDSASGAKDSTTFSSEVCKGRIQGPSHSHPAPTPVIALDLQKIVGCVVNQDWNDMKGKRRY